MIFYTSISDVKRTLTDIIDSDTECVQPSQGDLQTKSDAAELTEVSITDIDSLRMPHGRRIGGGDNQQGKPQRKMRSIDAYNSSDHIRALLHHPYLHGRV